MPELAKDLKSYVEGDVDVMMGVWCPGPPYRPVFGN